ncbi:MAG TPA: hypothetical protein VJN41_08840 [Alphaproteobacteria bacterium]|nr:hypothetical protein [Alphaproteobacteria bacterium]
MNTADVHPDVLAQLAELVLEPERPLIVCDGDEVIFEFIGRFADYLPRHGLSFSWASYHLTGNVLKGDGSAASVDEVLPAFFAFYDEHAESLEPVAGAAEALAALRPRAQVVVLSNLPLRHRQARTRNLARVGLALPVIANIGRKGPAVQRLAERVDAPVFFLDDSPRHLESVAELVPDAIRLHFVGNARLAALVETSPASHHRTDDWASARAIIEARLAEQGY